MAEERTLLNEIEFYKVKSLHYFYFSYFVNDEHLEASDSNYPSTSTLTFPFLASMIILPFLV